MDLEYISLHGYIMNTLSDKENIAEHHLRVGMSTWLPEEYIDPCKIWWGRRKEVGEKMRVSRTGPAPGRGGCVRGTEAGIRSPHWGIVWNREAFEAE